MGGIRTFMVSVVLLTGLITGMSLFYTDLYDAYDKNITDVSTISRASEAQATVSQMHTITENTNVLDVVGFIITTPFKAIKLVFDGLSIAQAMFVDMVSVIGVPQWFANTAMAAITLVVTLFAISVFLNRDV